MGNVIVGAAMSLDGFINDREGNVGRLYPDLGELRETDLLQEAMEKTGAVLMGRRTYDMGRGDYTGYEYQVPIFVVTHTPPAQPPKGQNENLCFAFVTDGIESAVRKARTAAGDKNVMVVGGANFVQQLLKAGLVDEIQVGLLPVFLGEGLRFFEHLGENIKLEKVKVIETGARTDLVFRVVK